MPGRTREYDEIWGQATPWSGAISLMPVPFLLLFPQVTGRNAHQGITVLTQPCPSCPAIHGNIYSSLYHIYPHSVCWFPLPSCADSVALSLYPLEHLPHSPAARYIKILKKSWWTSEKKHKACSITKDTPWITTKAQEGLIISLGAHVILSTMRIYYGHYC